MFVFYQEISIVLNLSFNLCAQIREDEFFLRHVKYYHFFTSLLSSCGSVSSMTVEIIHPKNTICIRHMYLKIYKIS